MKIERKTTFVVAGIEFQNLKTAQFFQRAIRLHTQDLYPVLGINALNEAEMLLRGWYNTLGVTETQVDKEALVEAMMGLQMPKPARKKKEIQNCMKEDFSLDGPMFRDEQLEADIKAETPYFLSSNLTD